MLFCVAVFYTQLGHWEWETETCLEAEKTHLSSSELRKQRTLSEGRPKRTNSLRWCPACCHRLSWSQRSCRASGRWGTQAPLRKSQGLCQRGLNNEQSHQTMLYLHTGKLKQAQNMTKQCYAKKLFTLTFLSVCISLWSPPLPTQQVWKKKQPPNMHFTGLISYRHTHTHALFSHSILS